MTDYFLSSFELNEVQNHDDFKVVWFGSRNNVPNELANFNDYLEKYYTFETCENYITTTQSANKILLVFTNFYEHLSHFNNLPQVQSIYILDKNDQNVQYEKEKYSKLVHVFTNERTLIERLRQDMLLTYRNDLSITISYLHEMKKEQSLIHLDRSTLFLWNQLFTYYLINAPDIDMEKLKQDMIAQCRLEYQNNKVQLNQIDNFDKNCTSDNVLEWYTGDSFVYRLVNKAFRTRNIDLIYKFRYFIVLLYNKLKQLSIQQQGENDTIVYRGQILGRNALKNLQSNVGCLISTNTMMSTTRNQDLARGFIAGAATGVIFEMTISSASNNLLYPFADISRLSSIPGEEEVLFFAGAVFRIDSVKEENNSTWIIKLTLSKKKVELIKQLMNGFKKLLTAGIQYGDLSKKTDDYSLFNKYHQFLTNQKFSSRDIAKLITHIDLKRLVDSSGNCQKAIDYYKQLLSNKNLIDHPKYIVFNIIIGNNYFRLSQYDNALDYYNIAFAEIDNNNRLKGEVYNRIGDVWRVTNNFETALLCYHEALKIIINHYNKDKDIPEVCRKITDIYLRENNYQDAFIYEDQANEIDKYYEQHSKFIDNETLLKHQQQLNTELDSHILEHAHMLYRSGMCWVRESHFSQGLEHLLKAEELFKKHLRIYDVIAYKLAKLYEHAAVVYLFLENYFMALVMWKKAIDIRISFNYSFSESPSN